MPAAAAAAASYHHDDAEEEVGYPDGLTEFEKERFANIKRNQALLEGLGLGTSSTILGHARGPKTKATPKLSRPKPPPRPPVEPTRRSLRNLSKEAPDYRDIPDFLFKPGSNGSNRPIGADDRGEEEGPGENWDPLSRPLKKAKLTGGASEPTPGSSRIMNANVEGMLAQYLGKKVPYTGKQTVMDLLSASGSPKFSKYAGVVEWKNAMVLWVNADGNDYANLFLKMGQEMTWFAGSRCHAETPVIQRLLEVGIDPAASKAKAAAADKGEDGDAPAAVVDEEGEDGLLEVVIDPAAVKVKALEAAAAAAAATALDSGDSGDKAEEKKDEAKEKRQGNKRKQKPAKAIAVVEAETEGPAGGKEGDREEEDGAAARGERGGQKDASSCASSEEASSSAAAGEGGEKEVTSSAAESAESDEILLFVRLTGQPYVCFGRVYHVWFDTRRHPIKMVWRLRDYEGLKGQADFEEIVGTGGPSSSAAVAAKEQ